MITVLFWNIHNNAVDEHPVRLVNWTQPDILVLAESDYSGDDLNTLLNSRLPEGKETFHVISQEGAKVQVLSRLKDKWQKAFKHDRYFAWFFPLSQTETLLFVTVHFPDARYERGDGQRKTAIELRQSREEYERAFEQNRQNQKEVLYCLIIGDFNASPFDAGIAGFYGLNASAHREIVEKHGSRTIGGQIIKFFYNPMWRFLGHPTTSGTFFDRLSAPVCYDWFIVDQALCSFAGGSVSKNTALSPVREQTGRERLGEFLGKSPGLLKIGSPNRRRRMRLRRVFLLQLVLCLLGMR